jgi:lipoate-protein ligase A
VQRSGAQWGHILLLTGALVELHRIGQAPDTLRYRSPPSVLLGRHQNMRAEVDVRRCLRKNIEIARRITGGSSVYMSPGILAFDLIVKRLDFRPRLRNSIACSRSQNNVSSLGFQ